MRTLCLVVAVLCYALAGHAQTVTITDERTGDPIPFATLTSEYPRAHTVSDGDGVVDLSIFTDSATIEVRSMGYRTLRITRTDLVSADARLALEPVDIQLDAVVVSANRWREPATKVPARLSVISTPDVRLQNPQTAADLLGVSDRVFIQKSQQGGGSPMIRGFATNRLLYAVDGVRMNTAIFRGGNIQNVISLDPFAIERTEVVFGPGSVIYGSDAIGGVMSFQTLRPRLSSGKDVLVSGSATARYSTANEEKTAHAHVNLGWRKWALVTSISFNDFGHLRQGSHGPDDYLRGVYVQRIDSVDRVVSQDDERVQRPTAYSQINLMQKLRFRPNRDWDLTYALHYSQTSSYGRYDRHNRVRNGLPRYAEWSYGPQTWMMHHLEVRHQRANILYDEATVRVAYQDFQESRITRDLNDADREVRTEDVGALSMNLDFARSLGGRATFFYGLEGVWNRVNSTGEVRDITAGTVSPGPARYPDSDWATAAAYLQADVELTDEINVQAGVRFTHFLVNSDFDTTFYPLPFSEASLNAGAVTGTLGSTWRPDENTAVYASAGSAFRAPNVDDIGKVFDSEPGAVVVPNPDLRAEYAWNVEAGVTRIFGKRLKLDASVYHTWLQNALVRRGFQLDGRDSIVYDGQLSRVQAVQNAARARVWGLQAGLELKLPMGFGLTSSANVQRGREELDDGRTSPSRHAAPWFGATRLTYRHERAQVQFAARYSGGFFHDELSVSERGKDEIYALDDQGRPFAPGWLVFDLRAQVRIGEIWRLGAAVENLTDRRYRPYSSGVSAPGRNVVISAGVDF